MRMRRNLMVGALLGAAGTALASSHREGPFITELPKVDATDFYMFRSYEPGREGYVTLIANYQPFQTEYGGPNFFTLDPDALYEIMVDNNGDAIEDLTFQFRFQNTQQNLALEIGPEGDKKTVPVALVNIGPLTAGSTDNLNVVEQFGMALIRGDRRTGERSSITNAATGERLFTKPTDNIGAKSIADYDAYAAAHVYEIAIPGCEQTGRVFVGQRKDSFVVNLGETFDLVNITNPLGPIDVEEDSLAEANVTSFVLELPIECLTSGDQTVIGAWTTASLKQGRVLNPTPTFERPAVEGGAWVQVSRLASPLVNEVVIGLPDKNLFNSSEPKDDGQFADYVTHPTLPTILEILFFDAGVRAPTLFPRTDLVAAFLTGVDGLNLNGSTAEMLRLNTAIEPTAADSQSNLGVLGADLAGFPNGRRPGDDVVDIELRVAMGALLDPSVAPSGQLPFTDGAFVDASFFTNAFPYLTTPLASSPNETP